MSAANELRALLLITKAQSVALARIARARDRHRMRDCNLARFQQVIDQELELLDRKQRRARRLLRPLEG